MLVIKYISIWRIIYKRYKYLCCISKIILKYRNINFVILLHNYAIMKFNFYLIISYNSFLIIICLVCPKETILLYRECVKP